MPHVDTPQSSCGFALAIGDITPPVGMYHRMWGAARHDQSTGIHRLLRATVAVFRSPDAPLGPDSVQVLIALDHCVMMPSEMNVLLDTVAEASGLAREAFLVVFSHTHAAGLLSRDRVSLPGGDLLVAYLDQLNQCVADLVVTALKHVQPAVIVYGTGRCDLAQHRDFWDDQGKLYVCGYNPQGTADDAVLVARVTDMTGQPLATMVNYACHPTTLGWENTLVSPDYPGALREIVEQATGVPCLFLQGASGDLGPKEGYVGDVAVADRHGWQLGHAALSALLALPPPQTRYEYQGPVVSGATLGVWSHRRLSDEETTRLGKWQVRRRCVALDYRADLPSREQVLLELQQQQSEEKTVLASGNAEQARELRALIERKTRLLSRLLHLPEGNAYPLQVVLWRIGDAIWLGVQGEAYSLLQTTVRQRFPHMAIVVASIAYDWSAAYLPPTDCYHKGIYQETIAVVAPGSLERLIDAIVDEIKTLNEC